MIEINKRSRKPAIVRFIGNEQTPTLFEKGKLYEAYFLEYWQGVRESLHVKGSDGAIIDFIPLSDFEIVEDEDDVLNTYEAIVKCVSHDYDDTLFDVFYGKEYKCIGVTEQGMFLVLDESSDCYFYPREKFEIIDDPHEILDENKAFPIYNW